MATVLNKIERCGVLLQEWSVHKFGNIPKRIKKLQDELPHLHDGSSSECNSKALENIEIELTDPNPCLRDALIELLFKDGRFRWNRIENLLVQGRKDRDFSAKDALQPVLKLLLAPDGEELRTLVIKEAVRVTEAIMLGSLIDTYKSLPEFVRALIPNGSTSRPLVLSDTELGSMLELRDQVYRIWVLLRSSENFDPALLQPILEVLQQPEARNLRGRVVGGISQRLAARLLQQVHRTPTTVSTSIS
ncbi:hypothetical protein SLE2022_175970 [Rubroshorea leprosula]